MEEVHSEAHSMEDSMKASMDAAQLDAAQQLSQQKSTLNPQAASFVPSAQRQPFVIVLIGPPGCGKTTIGHAIQRHYGFDLLTLPESTREARKNEKENEANWAAKYHSSMANNLLDRKLAEAKTYDRPGVVIEYVKTPEGAVIVAETCRRHSLRVGCTVFFVADDVVQLATKVQHRPDIVRHEEMDPQHILHRIHDFMYVEKALLKHYENDQRFFKVDALQSLPVVTLDVFRIIDTQRGRQTVAQSAAVDVPEGPSLTLLDYVPPQLSYLQFVRSKSETLQVFQKMQAFVGVHKGNTHRFPGTNGVALDEDAFAQVCRNLSKYLVAKKTAGFRYLFLYLRPQSAATTPTADGKESTVGSPRGYDGEESPSGCFLIDPAMALYRINVFPRPPPNWGDMLLDGDVLTVDGKGLLIIQDVLYFDGQNVMAERLDSRLEYLYNRFFPEAVMEQQVQRAPASNLVFVYANYANVRDLPRLVRELEMQQGTGLAEGLTFVPTNTAYKTCQVANLFEWKPSQVLPPRSSSNRASNTSPTAREDGSPVMRLGLPCLPSAVLLELFQAHTGNRHSQDGSRRGGETPHSHASTPSYASMVHAGRTSPASPMSPMMPMGMGHNGHPMPLQHPQRMMHGHGDASPTSPMVGSPMFVPMSPTTPMSVGMHGGMMVGQAHPHPHHPHGVVQHMGAHHMGGHPHAMQQMQARGGMTHGPGPTAFVAQPPTHARMPQAQYVQPAGGFVQPMGMHHGMMGMHHNGMRVQHPMMPQPVDPELVQLHQYQQMLPPSLAHMGQVPTPSSISNTSPILGFPTHSSGAESPSSSMYITGDAIKPHQVEPELGAATASLSLSPVATPYKHDSEHDGQGYQLSRHHGTPTGLPLPSPTLSTPAPKTPERHRRDVPNSAESNDTTPGYSSSNPPSNRVDAPTTPIINQLQRYLAEAGTPTLPIRFSASTPTGGEPVQASTPAPHDRFSRQRGSNTTGRQLESSPTPVRSSPAFRSPVRTPSRPTKDPRSPELSSSPSPQAVMQSRRTYAALLTSVKEWMIRKFAPPASCAHPRPFAVADVRCGDGVDVLKWEKHRANYLCGLDVSEVTLQDCPTRLTNVYTEMKSDFFQLNIAESSFKLPSEAKKQQFEVVACFFGLERAVSTPEQLRVAMQNMQSLLSKNGVLLLILVDWEVVADRVAELGRAFGIPGLYELAVLDNGAALTADDGFGVSFMLRSEDGGIDVNGTLINQRHVQLAAQEANLHYVDYGHLNFHEAAASYLKKAHYQNWTELPDEHRDLTQLFSTMVFFNNPAHQV